MSSVSVRDLRNHGGEVLDRVARGRSGTGREPVTETGQRGLLHTSTVILLVA